MALIAEEQLQQLSQEQMELERELGTAINLKDTVYPEPGIGPDVVELRITLPDNTQCTRRFLKSSPLSQLFSYIDFLDFLPSPYEIITESETLLHPSQVSFEEAGLYPKANLHVHAQGE